MTCTEVAGTTSCHRTRKDANLSLGGRKNQQRRTHPNRVHIRDDVHVEPGGYSPELATVFCFMVECIEPGAYSPGSPKGFHAMAEGSIKFVSGSEHEEIDDKLQQLIREK